MVTLKLILIMTVALAALLGYLAVFIFQAYWIIFVVLALTALMMVIIVQLTGGKVSDTNSHA